MKTWKPSNFGLNLITQLNMDEFKELNLLFQNRINYFIVGTTGLKCHGSYYLGPTHSKHFGETIVLIQLLV